MYHSTICIPARLFGNLTTCPEPATTELFLLSPRRQNTSQLSDNRVRFSLYQPDCVGSSPQRQLSEARSPCLRPPSPPCCGTRLPQQGNHQPPTRLPSRGQHPPLPCHRTAIFDSPTRLPISSAAASCVPVLEGEAKAQLCVTPVDCVASPHWLWRLISRRVKSCCAINLYPISWP